ncbi:MAG: FHA domain-containing protein [Oscillibacter sp.]|nr:FHA domain-containing protein [Oscillibacter sp.]
MKDEKKEEKLLLERLRKGFQDGIVYASQVRKKDRLRNTLNRLSLSAGQTPAQWLAARGLTWAETGYVEQDMRPRGKSNLPGGFTAYDVAHFVFRKYPLAGAYILTAEEDRLLYQEAKATIKQFLRADYSADRRACVTLVLESMRMIRGWNWPERPDVTNENLFWQYLFQQFGVHTENSVSVAERLIDGFTMAIDTVMEFYKRFLSPNTRLQYSTTLLIHALAPRSEMDDLFRELFHYYTRTLRYQYRAGDVGFGVLTAELLRQWDEEAEAVDPFIAARKAPRSKTHKIGRPRKDEQIRMQSPPISGVHALFRYRPDYAAELCDELVRKMDMLIKGEEALDTARNYWDLLLSEWYGRKSSSERARIQEARRNGHAEYVAVNGGAISARYAMREERVGLEFPGIRLPMPGDARPVLRLYQGDALIFSEKMEAVGAVPTTVGRFLPFDETRYDFDRAPELRVEIEYAGGLLYRSGGELLRQWLMFDEAGNARMPKSGGAWLFAGNAQDVSISGEAVRCDFPGQLWRFRMSDVSLLRVDGMEAFSASVSRFRHHTSQRRVDLAHVDVNGKPYDILPASFKLMIRMTDYDRAIRYSVRVDDINYPPEALEFGQSEILFIPIDTPQVPHRVQVFDQNGVLRDEYNYIILPGCKVSMDKRLYREASDEAAIRVLWNGRTRQYALPLPPGMDSVSLTLPGLAYPLEVDVPVVHCHFRGRNAFLTSESVWHLDIASDETVTLRLPSGWNGQLMCGLEPVPPVDDAASRFALGDMLAKKTAFPKEQPLWISLWDGSGHDRRVTYQIATLMFQPTFQRPPLEIENDKLLWQAEENFIGEAGSRFEVVCACPNGKELRFRTDSADAILCDTRDFREGRYDYQIFALSDADSPASDADSAALDADSSAPSDVPAAAKAVPADTQTIPDAAPLYDGSIIVGDKRKFAFTGKQIVVTGALCWDFDADDLRSIRMQEGCGVLRDILYHGSTLSPGESVPTPEYSATLYYTDEDADCLLPFHDRADDYFEQVNPVTLWTINEHLLILQGATGDTLYIDNQTASILYQNPDAVMSRDEQRERLETPDYFEYRVENDPTVKA